MKKIWFVIGLLLVGMSSSPARPVGVSFDVFYSSLSPMGEWISCDAGVYAWKPFGVVAGWRPYYNGRWCWTDDGWYWVSDEPWAWATYHYGRWYYDDFYGWVWIPGYDWAPAWVEWQYGGDFVGWAPLSPYAVFNISFGVRYRSSWITPHFWWSFVDCRHFGDPDVHRYIYRTEINTRYIGRTRPAGSVRYEGGRIVSRGPGRGYIEDRGRTRVDRVEIHDVADRPTDRLVRDSGRERVDVYRPRIEDRGVGTVRPERVREADHRIFPDTHNLDVRARDMNRGAEPAPRVEGAGEPRIRGDAQPRTPRAESFGRETVPQRRNEAPLYGRERNRVQQQPGRDAQQMQQRRGDVRPATPEWRGRQSDAPRIDRAPAPQRRTDVRSATPEWKGRRSEAPRIDRTPAPRREQPRGERGGGGRSESRGGGRRR